MPKERTKEREREREKENEREHVRRKITTRSRRVTAREWNKERDIRALTSNGPFKELTEPTRSLQEVPCLSASSVVVLRLPTHTQQWHAPVEGVHCTRHTIRRGHVGLHGM